MRHIEQIYINGEFVTPHGSEWFDLWNPATAQVTGQVRLADNVDAERAIAAAKAAFPAWAKTSKATRIAALRRMYTAVAARHDALLDAVIEEYGAPAARSAWMASYPAEVIAQAIEALEAYESTTQAGVATVQMTPLGVAGLITPWNSDAGFICGKLAAALAAGCTAVIKPSEMSALQTQIVTEALHDAGLPPGVFNIVTGRGDTVGDTIARHPDVAKISFTGSTQTGKAILRNAADSFKRVTLELGGKSPTLILEDADLTQAIPLAVQAGFMNSGQACVAGTRILVPQSREAECEAALAQAVMAVKSGSPRDPDTVIGPMVSEKQWQRVPAKCCTTGSPKVLSRRNLQK
jgi:aldehyde dehydrogenase (NAD+)